MERAGPPANVKNLNFAYLKQFYLVSLSLIGYFFLIYFAALNRAAIDASVKPILFFTLVLIIAFLFPLPIPRIRTPVYMLYPLFLLAILVLKEAAVVPYFLSSLYIEIVDRLIPTLRERKFEANTLLLCLWHPARMVPAFLLAAAMVPARGLGDYPNLASVPWGEILGMIAVMALYDGISANILAALSEGKPPWILTIPLIAFFDAPFAVLAVPVYFLFKAAGIYMLVYALLPVIAGLWLVRQVFIALSKRQEVTEQLNIANELIQSATDMKEMLSKIGAKVQEIVKADGVEIFVKGIPGWRLEAVLGKSPWTEASPGGFLETISVLPAQPTMVRDVRRDPRFASYAAAGLNSLLTIPLISVDEVIGCILCSNKVAHYFFGDHLEFAKILLGQLSSAMLNVQLHDQLFTILSKLQTANEELKRANELKSQFLTNVSHELRTPLTAIIGDTYFLRAELGGALTVNQQQSLDTIARSSERLIRMINDLLDLSRIEAERMKLQPTVCELESILRVGVDSLAPLAREKGISLDISCPPPMPMVYADPERIYQVIINLVGNAIKFTEKGGVKISAQAETEQVVIRVKDSGIGMPPEALKYIFEEFRQVDGSASRNKGGSGLGLAIAKKLIELQGGTMTAESALGEGSTFIFTVPIADEPVA